MRFLPLLKSFILIYIKQTLQNHNTENSKQIFIEKKLLGFTFLIPTYMFLCAVCTLCYSKNPLISLTILIQENTVGGSNVGIYRSLTDTSMWKLGNYSVRYAIMF